MRGVLALYDRPAKDLLPPVVDGWIALPKVGITQIFGNMTGNQCFPFPKEKGKYRPLSLLITPQ